MNPSGYVALAAAGKYEEAVEALNKGIAIDSMIFYLYENLAKNYLLKGFLNKAREALQQDLEISIIEKPRVDARFY